MELHGSHESEVALIVRVLGEPGCAARSLVPEWTRARSDLDWDFLCDRAVAHGLAPLLLRETSSLGWPVPEPARTRLEQAVQYCTGRAKKCQFTLYRFLEAGARHSLAIVLLKGAALVGSAYPDPVLRAMDDLDLLVRAEDLALARAVGEEIGLGVGLSQLPDFYYRLTNFAAPLHAHLETLVSIDLHWRLHSPALLLTDRIEEVWVRRRATSVYGFPAAVLDPADQWLHLATHLWSHWGRTPAPGQVLDTKALVAEPHVAVALKWLADLARATSRLAAEVAAKDLAERAAEWSAEAETALALSLLRPLLGQPALAFADDVGAALAPPRPARRRRSGASPQAGEVIVPLLGFRLGTLRRLPRWMFPPERYLRAIAGIGVAPVGPLTRLRLRVVHAARVAFRAALGAAALPIAMLGRQLAKRRREQRMRAARSPVRVAELLRKFRAFETAYAERFAPPHRSEGERR
jgi:hypothetical protein